MIMGVGSPVILLCNPKPEAPVTILEKISAHILQETVGVILLSGLWL